VTKRVFTTLEEQGLTENTIIIYAADNGYYMENLGFVGKWSHFEESLRVPLAIYDPRKPKQTEGKVSDRMSLNIDIPTTGVVSKRELENIKFTKLIKKIFYERKQRYGSPRIAAELRKQGYLI
jgi:arylsulfatase A-like enzyme